LLDPARRAFIPTPVPPGRQLIGFPAFRSSRSPPVVGELQKYLRIMICPFFTDARKSRDIRSGATQTYSILPPAGISYYA
jgi:hypothetical protein